jgi:hypothetical protein
MELSMKTLLFTMIATCSLSAFSADLATTIREVEQDKNAKCSMTSEGQLLCSGRLDRHGLKPNPQSPFYFRTCWQNIKFNCVSNENDFTLKARVRERYNSAERTSEVQVTKLIFSN